MRGNTVCPCSGSRAGSALAYSKVRACMHVGMYMGTLLIRKRPFQGSYGSSMLRALWWSWGGGSVSYERGTPAGCCYAHRHGPAVECCWTVPVIGPQGSVLLKGGGGPLRKRPGIGLLWEKWLGAAETFRERILRPAMVGLYQV